METGREASRRTLDEQLLVMGPWLEPRPLERRPLVIGRAEDSDIRLPAPTVSRYHAEVSRHVQGGICVRDLGSRNGTIVDGELLRTSLVVRRPPTRLHVGPFDLLVTGVAAPGADTLTGQAVAVIMEIDHDTREVILDGESLGALPRLEFRLLEGLIGEAPSEVTSQAIGDYVWGAGAWDTYMLYNMVRRLRQRLTSHSELVAIEAIRSRGYRLTGVLLVR